jgi:hypothetical protein
MTGNPASKPNGSVPPSKALPMLIQVLPQLVDALPQMMAQALASVLQQVPVQTRQHLCATCVLARLTWNLAHERELTAALTMAAQVHGLADGDPRLAQLDPAPFLPEALRPGGPQGMPPAHPSITTVGGTEVCSEHIPGRQGGKQLLLASGPLSQGMLASLG